MTNLNEIQECNNFFKLKKIAEENNIKLDADDKVKEIKHKLLLKFDIEGKEKLIFTYIGKGLDSPVSINFMGKLRFTRGVAREVENTEENKRIIKKLNGNPCFVNREIEFEEIERLDKEEETRVNKIRSEDREIDKNFKKNN